jgi:hypothetical protein
MTDLKLYEGKAPVRVTAATLFNVVKAIIAAGEEADFLQKAGQANVALEASPEAVNFVKEFLHKSELHKNNELIAHIVSPMAGAPTCF